MTNICVSCHYARMRKDICGIYCVGSFFKKSDGSCDRYINYKDKKKINEQKKLMKEVCK